MEQTRRERKRRQTRRLLFETALRLFDEQGYQQTSVAQIAAAADVATKTFFNHFPTKEAVLFAETQQAERTFVELGAERRPGESVADVLTRALDQLMPDYWSNPTGFEDPELTARYVRVVSKEPFLRGQVLDRAAETQRVMARQLTEAFPELDLITASALVGALVGATQAAGRASIQSDDPLNGLQDALLRAIEVAMRGIRAY
jgi:AcrR family transcriptional regulator